MVADSVRLGHALEDTSQLSFQTQTNKINTLARELGYCCFNPGLQTIPSRMCMESPGKSLGGRTAAGHLWHYKVEDILRGLFQKKNQPGMAASSFFLLSVADLQL